jgi:general secretion pathway protein D
MIALVIAHVDRELEEATLPYVIYPLENQDPTELAEVLIKVIEKTTRAKAASAKDAKVQTRPTTTTKLEEEVTIVPDVKSYSLIVYASKKNQQWISSLIKKLDEYRPQVLLDCTLVEITKNDAFNFDLDLVSKFPTLVGGGTMESGWVDALLEPFGSKSIIEVSSNPNDEGAATAFYSDNHIQALFTLMAKKGYGRVLARPKLLVNDNEKGTIKAEEKKYIARKETSRVAGTATGTTSPVTNVKFESFNAGVTLDIEPHISKGNQLRLKITMNRTDFSDTVRTIEIDGESVELPRDTNTSDITTVVTVPDEATIILGGLEKLKQSKSGSKIPLLGDIPIVGGLFKDTHNTDTQNRLYVFVKAHILRPGIESSDIERVSDQNRRAFEEMEKRSLRTGPA